MLSNPSDIVRLNYQNVVSEVAEAAQKANRNPEEITVVGVSKYVDSATTEMLFNAGCKTLGESRPQSLWDKAEQLSHLACDWHMIGHLQRNKLRRTLPLVSLVHSIDSLRLADSISTTAVDLGLTIHGLLEINISGDESKHGFSPNEVSEAIESVHRLDGLRIVGLMAMSGLDSSPADARREFAEVRILRDALATGGLPPSMSLHELSMGMSGDFKEAIAEGATLIRVGSRLFEGLV